MRGYDNVHGGFDFRDKNEEGAAFLDFVRAFGLVVVNFNFSKKVDHLITFWCAIAKTQIDFLLLRKGNRAMCKDCEGDVDTTWDRVVSCIKEIARERLGVSRGRSGKNRRDWWWNREVKKKVEIKTAIYTKLVEIKDKKEKRTNMEEYKVSRKEAKLAVTIAKTTFERLYTTLQKRDEEKRLYSKDTERRDRDLDQVSASRGRMTK
ncbi:uncharacterized protein LOC107852259 [Capsicum annuum]|uniref:uncharacterized protein LOC107852259 n=1 Tax=Capsicum annuum TaxID=4072 RepID=UPI0007BFE4FB|nr:uncharacterized protein LOC107852259 [Capsicum annuum]